MESFKHDDENNRNEDKYTDKDGTELENKAELVWEGQVIWWIRIWKLLSGRARWGLGMRWRWTWRPGMGLVWQIIFPDKTAQLWWYEVQALPYWGICEGTLQKGNHLRFHKSQLFVFNIFNVFRLVVSIIGIMHTALPFWQTLMKPRKLWKP